MTEPTETLVHVEALTKRFGETTAIDHLTLSIGVGEVLGLLGENGAGKSTLVKCLAGIHQPDSGTIRLADADLHLSSAVEAQRLGIATIYQELTLIPSLTVAENIFLGREPKRHGLVDRGTMRRDAAELLSRLGQQIDPDAMVRELSLAQHQFIEIARALSMQSRLLVMDEPTASLGSSEVEELKATVRRMRAEGVSVLFISHRLDEVKELCDRVVVLRDGRNVGGGRVVDLSTRQMAELMVGRDFDDHVDRQPPDASSEVLRVCGLASARAEADVPGTRFIDVSFVVHQGEILGLAGLVGSGRTSVARTLMGLARSSAGTVEVNGDVVDIRSPRHAARAGLALVPEDRKAQGLFAPLSCSANFSLPSLGAMSGPGGWIRRRDERAAFDTYRESLSIRLGSHAQPVGELSGGNQQKVVIARWLEADPAILIVDEPTRGVDIGAKADVHRLLSELTMEGMSLLVISSDLPELLTLCDRIVVMREGRVTGELSKSEASEAAVARLMMMEGEAA